MRISDWSSDVCSSDLVAAATIAQLPVEARKRIFYLDFADNFAGGKEDTRMINLMFEFFTSTKFVWNDSLQDKFTIRTYDEEGHDVWVINPGLLDWRRSEEHTSELQSLMRNSYAVFCLKNKNIKHTTET